jgi:hypothetical protein
VRRLAAAACAALPMLALGCEYRDHATSLSLEHSCYDVSSGDSVAVRAQARGSDDRPISGLKVRWLVEPPPFTITPDVDETGASDNGGLHGEGIATATVTAPAADAIVGSATVVAVAAVEGTLLTARADLRVRERATACSEGVDAGGLDAPDVDAPDVDAPDIDAPDIDAPDIDAP